MSNLRVIAAFSAMAGCAWAGTVTGDAKRGQELFQSQQCVQCHTVNGRGGGIAPDLTRRIDRDYTPAVMTSLMWNHAPAMWEAMRKQNVVRQALDPEGAADLFAFFVSARYFEKPGDAGRGKMVFAAKHCSDCHGITSSSYPAAPPVAKWESLADPVVLAQQMWNHSGAMRQAFAEKKLEWSRLTGQELTDLLVYLQNLPETKEIATNFLFPPSEPGEKLFVSKGCSGCHKNGWDSVLRTQTLTDIAADMWNHEPGMKQPPPQLSQEEMRQIIGYIWGTQYFRGQGNAERGKKVFAAKSCAACHNDASSGAPKLAKGKDGYSDIVMVSALWQHGPHMLDLMTQRKIAWPRFTAQQMSDLIAYLNSL